MSILRFVCRLFDHWDVDTLIKLNDNEDRAFVHFIVVKKCVICDRVSYNDSGLR